MRIIGRAEEALEKMVKRLTSRTAFGKKLFEHSVWEQRIGEARTDLEMTRLLCLKAADMMDKVGNKAAQLEIAMIKVAALFHDAAPSHDRNRAGDTSSPSPWRA
jgi:acyl-CoA dehydrogenase